VAVDLTRIDGDQVAVEPTGGGNGDCGFPAGRGTDDRDDALDA
jgi:hypothetical protein